MCVIFIIIMYARKRVAAAVVSYMVVAKNHKKHEVHGLRYFVDWMFHRHGNSSYFSINTFVSSSDHLTAVKFDATVMFQL